MGVASAAANAKTREMTKMYFLVMVMIRGDGGHCRLFVQLFGIRPLFAALKVEALIGHRFVQAQHFFGRAREPILIA